MPNFRVNCLENDRVIQTLEVINEQRSINYQQ